MVPHAAAAPSGSSAAPAGDQGQAHSDSEAESEDEQPAPAPDHPHYHGRGWWPGAGETGGEAGHESSRALSSPCSDCSDSTQLFVGDARQQEGTAASSGSPEQTPTADQAAALQPPRAVETCTLEQPLPPVRRRCEPVAVQFTQLQRPDMPARQARDHNLPAAEDRLRQACYLLACLRCGRACVGAYVASRTPRCSPCPENIGLLQTPQLLSIIDAPVGSPPML